MRDIFRYPFSRRWIILSLFLCIASLFLAFAILGIQVYLFFILAFPQVLLFTMIKIRLYKKLDSTDLNPLLYLSESARESTFYPIMLVTLVFFGFALPFLLLLLLDPVMWFISLLSFVLGINAPELVLYFLSEKEKRKQKRI